MMTPRMCRIACVVATVILSGCTVLLAAPAPEQQAYWWMDELRSVAFALSEARAGKVSQWPRLTVPAGSAALPLPSVSGPVTADGRLDEPAWKQATRFPVGPIFGPWRDGPVTLQVSACRNGKTVYLAIESPRDLSALGSLTGRGELFAVAGRPYRIETLPNGSVQTASGGQTIELALPHQSGKPVALSFACEVVRLSGGKAPPEMASLGLTKAGLAHGRSRRRGTLWLQPITITLTPADVAAQLSVAVKAPGDAVLVHKLITQGKAPKAGDLPLTVHPGSGVARYDWQAKHQNRTFRLEGFVYVEPVLVELRAAREIARRGPSSAAAPLAQEIDRLQQQARRASPADRKVWRGLYGLARELRARAHLALLDAPLLFVKRHPYFAAHIYDDYYTWHPGGGIYVLENPADPSGGRKVRAVIDAQTKTTLGAGVYRDAELSWDARRIVFAYKPASKAMTSIYEIGIDGKGLRRLTESDRYHDITPTYLPGGRIVFTSTRPRGRVPCFNSGVDTLHTMDPDGSNIRSISSNNVTEFDPAILPDGRILYGRWEYVDKTALYMQSLWTTFPDGTNETALFANNLPKPTAVLDARAVPGTALVVASLTPHNGQAVGAIGMIDPALGKNNLGAVTNFTPEYPIEMDQGLMVGPCDPWALSKDDVLAVNDAVGAHGIVELIDRQGHRELVHCAPALSCFSPKLVRPRRAPGAIAPAGTDVEEPGRFLVVDVYRGLAGVKRGEVKRLRIIEETARTSEVPPGGRWWNQAFLISWQGAYVVKNFLGTVPVYPDGSAYFEAPPGRALYVEALDADGREIQRMRTFVQAVPGVTRSCIGCHEPKLTSPRRPARPPMALRHPPAKPEPESWGSGFIDYATMIQPILDKHCVRCHGGEKGMAGDNDLSGGWTWAFSISYEMLLKNNLVGFIRCHNSDTTSSEILAPRTIGSGAAPLGNVLLSGHKDRIPNLTRGERDLLMAWMDGNSNYYGTWDYTPHATCGAILAAGKALASEMQKAGCTRCHAAGHIGNDWINLRRPEYSRILRGPLVTREGGLGLAWCRERKAQRGLPLVTQRHMPPDVFRPPNWPKRDPDGVPHTPFASTDDAHYQAMLKIIRDGRRQALAGARVDMPGAEVVAGVCRLQVPMPLPDPLPRLTSRLVSDGVVELLWPRNAQTIGLEFEVHRDARSDFEPTEKTRLHQSHGFLYVDAQAPTGRQHYALVVRSGPVRSTPCRATVTVPEPVPPPAPARFVAEGEPGQVALAWQSPGKDGLRYNVYRAKAGSERFEKITDQPVGGTAYFDTDAAPGAAYAYVVRCVSRRGTESDATPAVTASALPVPKEAVFAAPFGRDIHARLVTGAAAKGRAHGGAAVADGVLDLRRGGHVTFGHRPEFDLARPLTVECWVRFDQASQMPVIVSCGKWQGAGWFLQGIGGGWRWYCGGVSCDGGKSTVGRWIHLLTTFDGRRARVYQDGREVASAPCRPDLSPWPGPLFVGQYGPGPGPQYQVAGRIAGLKLYRRALSAQEAAAAFKAGPPAGK